MFKGKLRSLFLSICLLQLASCSRFTSPKPPVILVLIESFSEKDFLCSDLKQIEGLEVLNSECENFSRFTHVFAPSGLTQPAMATLFTGKELNEHGVIHNGSLAISGSLQTLAESALSLGMRTALFSGGIPLIPKFGIRQGFEVYSDSFAFKKNTIFRPFYKSLARSTKWMDEELGRHSFFMTFYVPDLLHTDLSTRDHFGEERPANRPSQLNEIYETLNQMIVSLKKRKKWENSHVIILGLSGEKENLVSLNPLNSSMLHVPLLIKLAKATKSNIKEMTESIVSFSLLGQLIDQLLLQKPSQGTFAFSFGTEDSLIPQFSYWQQWLELANGPDIGLREKHYLYSWTPQLSIYDSYGDKKETEPLIKEQALKVFNSAKMSEALDQYFTNECFDASYLQNGWVASRSDCKKPEKNQSLIRNMTLISKWSDLIWNSDGSTDPLGPIFNVALSDKEPLIMGWLAFESLYKKNWVNLFELGIQTKNKSWMLVSQANLRESPNFKVSQCLKYFVDENMKIENFYKHCQDSELRKVVEGIRQLKNKRKPAESFWNQVADIKNKRRAKKINLKMNFVNDIYKPFEYQPSLAELYFFLPENIEFQNLIEINEA